MSYSVWGCSAEGEIDEVRLEDVFPQVPDGEVDSLICDHGMWMSRGLHSVTEVVVAFGLMAFYAYYHHRLSLVVRGSAWGCLRALHVHCSP